MARKRGKLGPGDQIEGYVIRADMSGVMRTPSMYAILWPWLGPHGELRKGELRVEVPMSSDASARRAAKRWRGRYVAATISKYVPALRGRLDYPVAPKLRAVPAAPALLSAKNRWPATLKHPFLGQVTFSQEFSWFEGGRETRRARYRFCVSAEGVDDEAGIAPLLDGAAERLRHVEKSISSVRDRCVNALYADLWDEPPPSEAAFRRSLRVNLVSVDSAFTCVYLDCIGFGEHGAEVHLSPAGEVTFVGMS